MNLDFIADYLGKADIDFVVQMLKKSGLPFTKSDVLQVKLNRQNLENAPYSLLKKLFLLATQDALNELEQRDAIPLKYFDEIIDDFFEELIDSQKDIIKSNEENMYDRQLIDVLKAIDSYYAFDDEFRISMYYAFAKSNAKDK